MLPPTKTRKSLHNSPAESLSNYVISDLLAIFNLLLCVLSCQPPFVEKGDYCVRITQPTTFENGCNVQTFRPFDDSLYQNWGIYVWLPVGRRYNFGPMFFQKPGPEYATAFENVETVSRDNCMVVANKTLQYVDCVEKHPHLCAYYNGADKYTCSGNSAAFSFKSCVCKLINSDDSEEEEDDGDEDEDCELKTDFTTDEKITEMVAVPETTGLNVCYMASESKSECRVGGEYVPKVDLVLKFDVKKRKLFLTVYSLEG